MIRIEEDERWANLAQNYVCTEDIGSRVLNDFGPDLELETVRRRLEGVFYDICELKNKGVGLAASRKLYLCARGIETLISYLNAEATP